MANIAEPNSGRDVPIAAAVTPSIISEIPKVSPISTKLSTNKSAAFITINKEIIKLITKIIVKIINPPAICFLLLVYISFVSYSVLNILELGRVLIYLLT
ncbi:MAG: hypothetical protein Kow0019_12890 [Methanobacteriaceae archaeon]